MPPANQSSFVYETRYTMLEPDSKIEIALESKWFDKWQRSGTVTMSQESVPEYLSCLRAKASDPLKHAPDCPDDDK